MVTLNGKNQRREDKMSDAYVVTITVIIWGLFLFFTIGVLYREVEKIADKLNKRGKR